MKTTRLRVTLLDVVPPVTRVLDLPAPATFPDVHNALQAALGWTDGHLHQFVTDEHTYGVPMEDALGDELDESGVRLAELPSRFRYLYDFGDGWQHSVEVLGVGCDQPGCVAGEGDCPPEDVGGPPGYEHLLEVLADPGHEEYDDVTTWAGDRGRFDLAAADLLLRQMVGVVPSSVALLLELLDGGVRLTPGGRLPRVIVREVQSARPQWYPLGRPANVEKDLLPLFDLHELLRKVGLLRLSAGVLRPTKAAADDLQTIRRLRTFFPLGSFEDIVAGVVPALLVTRGPQPAEALAKIILPMVGSWSMNGQPLTVEGLRRHLYQQAGYLRGLDLIVDRGHGWAAGPSAVTLLPRATRLAALWRR